MQAVTSRQILSSVSCSAEPTEGLPDSAAAVWVDVCPCTNRTLMAASHGALSTWVSNCLAAKMRLGLQRFSGLRSHNLQNLLFEEQVRCLHARVNVRAHQQNVPDGQNMNAGRETAQARSSQRICAHESTAVRTAYWRLTAKVLVRQAYLQMCSNANCGGACAEGATTWEEAPSRASKSGTSLSNSSSSCC